MRSNFLLKLSILLLLLAVICAKSSIIMHEYSHNNAVEIEQLNDDAKDETDCLLCEFAKISSKLLIFLAISLVISLNFFINILSRLSKLRICYLLFSKFSRAPPFVI